MRTRTARVPLWTTDGHLHAQAVFPVSTDNRVTPSHGAEGATVFIGRSPMKTKKKMNARPDGAHPTLGPRTAIFVHKQFSTETLGLGAGAPQPRRQERLRALPTR